MALETDYRLPSLTSRPERHITSNATEEVKLDGRALGIKANGMVLLCFRNNKKYLSVAKAVV